MHPGHAQAARDLGREIGTRGWQLVYGGGNVGLMGALADAALAAGGRVVGVIPDSLMQREVGHHRLHELHIVPTMHARKQMMAERADAFCALAGGIGTLEELYEVWTWRHLGYHDRPIGLLNSGGYYDALLGFMQHAAAEGFVDRDQLDAISIADEVPALLDMLARRARAAPATEDFGRI